MATYISNRTGDWNSANTWLTAAAGTFSPTGSAGAAPQSGGLDKIVIRSPHVVTYNTSGIFGNGGNGNNFGTSNQNVLSASIILSGGGLRASRTVNTALTALGTIWVGGNDTATSGSFWDWGTATDPVSAVTATIAMSGVSTGACGMVVKGSTSLTSTLSNSVGFWGLEKTRNTFLTLSAAAGQPIITVDNAYNWSTNDEIVIESDTIATTRALTGVRIQSINGKNITLNTNLNFARLSGTRVGNFTSTVTYGTLPSMVSLGQFSFGINIEGLVLGNYQFGYLTLNDFGQYWRDTGITYIAVTNGVIQYNSAYNKVQPSFKGIAYIQTRGPTVAFSCINIINTGTDEILIDDFACNAINSTSISQGLTFGSDSFVKLTNSTFYRCWNAIYPSATLKATVNNCYINSESVPIGYTNSGISRGNQLLISNSKIRSNNSLIFTDGVINAVFNTCNITTSATDIARTSVNAYGNTTVTNCTFSGATYNILNNVQTIRDYNFNVFNVNNDNNYITFNYYHYAQANSSVRKNGIRSLAFTPKVSNTAFVKIFTAPATQGVNQKIKGNLRFDSNYGTATPPSITFGGAVNDTTFTCPPVIDTWHSFEYDLTPTFTGDIELKITGKSANTNGFVYVDGLILDPFVSNVRWYGFEVDKNAYRTANSLNTLTENQVSALATVSNLDYLYDAASYWSITNPASSSYIDLFTVNGTILDFGTNNIIINNTGTGFSYNSASSTITINAPSLSAGTNFNTIKTSGTVTLSTGIISNIDINANLIQTIPTSLNGVYMLSSSNTLTYNTNTPIEIEYTNCTVVGVKNDGTALVTIKRTNSTVTESDAEVTTYAPTIINLTLQGGYAAIYDDTGTRQYYTNSNGTVVLGSTSSGSWSYKIARYGYQLISGNFTVNPSVGGTIDIAPNYIPDAFITVANVSTVSGYTDLNTYDKIHNYLSYNLTTSTGINYGELDSESFGVLSFYGNLIMSGSAASIIDYNNGSNTLKLKSSTINDSIIFVVASAFTQDGGNTIGDNLKIRSSNLDSELYFNNVNAIAFYPTQLDRDNNTNVGISLSSVSIYRFKYGSTVNGITFTDYIYSRVTVDGSTLLYKTAITTGSTTIDFGTVGNLQTILNNQRIINIGVQKASKLIPHTTNI